MLPRTAQSMLSLPARAHLHRGEVGSQVLADAHVSGPEWNSGKALRGIVRWALDDTPRPTAGVQVLWPSQSAWTRRDLRAPISGTFASGHRRWVSPPPPGTSCCCSMPVVSSAGKPREARANEVPRQGWLGRGASGRIVDRLAAPCDLEATVMSQHRLLVGPGSRVS
jgi:hypothetical protein